MKPYQIIIAGVGGQGLILTTKIICDAGMQQGYDVKSNDVVGLAQRGGKVWGSVKLAEKVASPNIAVGKADLLLGMELLEAYRWRSYLKKEGKAILNHYQIPPVPVIAEEETYPEEILQFFKQKHETIVVDAVEKSKMLGEAKAANTLMLGVLAKKMTIDQSCWENAIIENVPPKLRDINLKIFQYGFNYSQELK